MIRAFLAFVVSASLIATFVACDSSAGGSDDGSSTSSGSGASCDIAGDKWYTDCTNGCGDLMVCQSFCSTCDSKCMVPCNDSSDCEAVGAGSCEESAQGSNRCSAAPTKCPAETSTSGGGNGW